MRHRILLGGAVLLLVVLVGVGAVTHQLLRGQHTGVLLGALATRLVPGLSPAGVDGSLYAGSARLVHWRQGTVEVLLREVEWKLAPECNPLKDVCIERFRASSIEILSRGDDEGTALPLAPLQLPVTIAVEDAIIGQLSVRQGAAETLRAEDLAFAAGLKGTALSIERFTGGIRDWQVQASGRIDIRDRLPMFLQGQVARGEEQTANILARGDLRRLSLRANTASPMQLEAEGWIEPLGEDLPMQFDLRPTGPLPLPAGVAEWLSLPETELHVEGNLRELHGVLKGELNSDPLGVNQLEARASITPKRLIIESAQLTGAAGELKATGKLALDAERAWSMELEGRALGFPGISHTLDARLDGTARLEGTLAATPFLRSATLALEGTANGLPASLRGTVVPEGDHGVRLQAFELGSGPNRLSLDGLIGDTLQLDGDLQIADLAATLRGASGHGSGRLSLRGSTSAPLIEARMQLAQIGWRGWGGDDFRVELAGGRDTLGLQADLSRGAKALALRCNANRAGTRQWDLRCPQFALRGDGLAWTTESTLEIALLPDSARIQPFCLRDGEASLCNTQRIEVDARGWRGVSLQGRSLSLAPLSALLPSDTDVAGLASLEASASSTGAGGLRLDATLRSTEIGIELPAAGQTVPLSLGDVVVAFGIEPDHTRLQASSRIGDRGSLAAALQVQGRGASSPVEGHITLDSIDIAPLVPRTPGLLDVGGELAGRLRLEGTVDAPRLAGGLQLAEAQLAHERLPEPLRNVDLAMDFDGPVARIDGSFDTSAGRATLRGDARWHEHDWSADLQLDAEKLRIEPIRGSTMSLAPALHIALGPHRAEVKGVVEVPEANIDMSAVPDGADSISPDVIEIGAPQQAQFDYRIDLDIRLGKDVRFRGFGAEARLGGALALHGAAGSPYNGEGEIRILDGRYAAWGQRLEVSDGRLLFRGPLDSPGLQIEAVRPIEDEQVTVGVRVRGTAREPETRVFSRPVMPESRALHYLMTGRAPVSGETAGLGAAGALISVGAAGASKLTGGLLEQLGIERFAIDTRTAEDGTEVMISGYITPELYLRYGVSTFDEANTFRLRYRLTPRFFVEAVSGIENAVDFLYSFER